MCVQYPIAKGEFFLPNFDIVFVVSGDGLTRKDMHALEFGF